MQKQPGKKKNNRSLDGWNGKFVIYCSNLLRII